MTAPYSSYNSSLTVRFSQMVEYKLFPWFDEAISAHARLNFPLFGISQPMQQLFPKYTSTDHKSVKVFAASLDFVGPSGDVPKDVCLKLARGVDEVVRLSHEASVYRKQLSKLWGIAVPKMYGFFIGHYEDTPVACLLLELCLGPTVLPSDSEGFVYVLFPSSVLQPVTHHTLQSPSDTKRAEDTHSRHNAKHATRIASFCHEGRQSYACRFFARRGASMQ